MSTTANTEFTSNDLILQMLKAKPKTKKSIEQLDTDSINTMDYYKEENSTRNSIIEESKSNKKSIFNPKKEEKKQILLTEGAENSYKMNKKYKDLHISSNVITTNNVSNPKTQISQKRPNNRLKYCCKNYSDVDINNKTCLRCLRKYCKKCFKGNFKQNLDNNGNNSNNYENDMNKEKICFYCKRKEGNKKEHTREKQISDIYFIQNVLEPMDNSSENDIKIQNMIEKSKTKNNVNNRSHEKMKNLEEQFKEFDYFLHQIEDRKKEIKIKKDISINLLQMMQKVVESEYEKYINKLNEFVLRLNKIKNNISEKLNKIYNNETELQINIDMNKNSLNNLSKIFDNFSKKVISRPLFRGYKLYESDNILINYSDTYYMKSKEIFSDLPFGNVSMRVDRYTNNYVNYLNFSALIKQNDKTPNEDIINCSFQSININNNRSRFVVYMIVNNKLIRLNKTNKDNNDKTLNYETSEEENKIIFSKNQYNNNIIAKKNNFNIKVIISEISL